MRKTIASVESELNSGFSSGLGNAQGTAEGLGGVVPEDADGAPQDARVVVDMDRVSIRGVCVLCLGSCRSKMQSVLNAAGGVAVIDHVGIYWIDWLVDFRA